MKRVLTVFEKLILLWIYAHTVCQLLLYPTGFLEKYIIPPCPHVPMQIKDYSILKCINLHLDLINTSMNILRCLFK